MLNEALSPLASPWLAFVLRMVLAAVLVMAALSKLLDNSGFVRNVQQYRLLPPPVARTFALGLPFVELPLALMLLAGFYSWVAALLFGLLLLSFMIAVAVALRRKLNLSCSCFGLLYREKLGPAVLARDSVLLAASAHVALFDRSEFTVYEKIAEFPSGTVASLVIISLLVLGASTTVALRAARHYRRIPSPSL